MENEESRARWGIPLPLKDVRHLMKCSRGNIAAIEIQCLAALCESPKCSTWNIRNLHQTRALLLPVRRDYSGRSSHQV